MKNARLFAWLLIVAMLAMVCPAFADEQTIDLNDGAALEIPDDFALDAVGDIDIGGEDVSLELPNPELAGDVSYTSGGNASADGEAGGDLAGSYRPNKTFDNDALFAGYVDMLFGKKDKLGLQSNGWVGDRLKNANAKAYNYLLEEIKKVASGSRSNTEIVIPSSVLTNSQAVDVFYDFPTVVDALLLDCPYHLFWYDKVNATPYGVNDGKFYVRFPVAKEYASSTYKTNTTKIKAAGVAVTNAKKVVKKYAGVSDYKKLCGYRDYICKAVKYNDAAVADSSRPYGNPWQLIWVFDGNSSTDVVCEGYAKAFQYLCDLSSFKSRIQCHVVSGDGGSENNVGPHMWNVVTMGDGKNYHTDITFVDSGLPGAFLAGAVPTGNGNFYRVADLAYYQFDQETRNTYPAKTLKLSTSKYDPSAAGKATKPTKVAIAQGKSATLYMGNKLTLKAKLTPSNASTTLKWSSSNSEVAVVSSKGVVTPKKAGTAKITVKTANKLSAMITIKVVDASSVKLIKGKETLKKGQSIKLKRGKSLTLKASVSPAKVKTKLTWSSSNKNVIVKDGKITVKSTAKVGTKAKITVKTANKKSTYIYIVVK